MIGRCHGLPLARQAELLGLSRSSLYYEARPVPASELAIMRRLDVLHMDYPFAGSRMPRDLLRGEGVAIGRGLVATMMRRMGEAGQGSGGAAVGMPDKGMDITYIPMARGFVSLAAVADWFSRGVLAWRL